MVLLHRTRIIAISVFLTNVKTRERSYNMRNAPKIKKKHNLEALHQPARILREVCKCFCMFYVQKHKPSKQLQVYMEPSGVVVSTCTKPWMHGHSQKGALLLLMKERYKRQDKTVTVRPQSLCENVLLTEETKLELSENAVPQVFMDS